MLESKSYRSRGHGHSKIGSTRTLTAEIRMEIALRGLIDTETLHGLSEDSVAYSSALIVISKKFATFVFTFKPCPGRGYSDDQCLKVLHFPVKRLYIATTIYS